MTPPYNIRPALPEDVETLVALIRELAVYEHLEHRAVATPAGLREHLFGARPYAEALLADVAAGPVGFALFFPTYSTFRGQPSLYLEDIFVRPAHRGRGIGKGLFKHVAEIAVARGCGRLEWAVLNWNEAAIGFYRSLGARPQDEWTLYRLDDSELMKLALEEGFNAKIAKSAKKTEDMIMRKEMAEDG